MTRQVDGNPVEVKKLIKPFLCLFLALNEKNGSYTNHFWKIFSYLCIAEQKPIPKVHRRQSLSCHQRKKCAWKEFKGLGTLEPQLIARQIYRKCHPSPLCLHSPTSFFRTGSYWKPRLRGRIGSLPPGSSEKLPVCYRRSLTFRYALWVRAKKFRNYSHARRFCRAHRLPSC